VKGRPVPSPAKIESIATQSPHIEAITTTIVNLPLVTPYRWVAGLYHGSTKVVVEVKTSDGVVGLGEASNWRYAALIEEELAPRLIGRRATDLRECWRAAVPPVEMLLNTETQDIVRAYGAVEMALWDVRGKVTGLPLYALLGGAARTRIPFSEYFAERERVGSEGGEKTAAEIAAYCARMVEEHGSPFFEGKVGYCDLETDVAIAREVREAIGPTRSLRLDANMGWKLSTAREALRSMADLRIANIEDPVAGIESMAQLREHSTIPFSTHDANLLRAAVRLGVPDSFVLNLTSLGGIERTMRFISACEAVGIGFSFYSGESGIGVAAYLHVAAAVPYLSTPSQSLLRWYADDIILGGPLQPEEGHLEVPNMSGLGIELDRDAVERAHEDYLKHGPLDQAAPDPLTGIYNHPPLY
jgi:glucarate dehydratase